MKTIISTLLLCIVSFTWAQLTVTTNFREDGTFDESNLKWDISSTEEGMTVFSFDKDLTRFRHVTNNISSVYTINDWTYNEEEVLYEMVVTSDAGNEYDFMIDGINMYVIFFYYDSNGVYTMVRHTISDSYYDE